ncbi:MAG: helix-turn-helix domain-containing protein [Coriobacteriales bacterium]|nr:helix-turn-helix domain-containing protein [Coriobacteriales bacterium]
MQSVLGTMAEAAKVCNISNRYAYRLAEQGKIPAVQIGNVWRVNMPKLREQLGIKEKDAYENA